MMDAPQFHGEGDVYEGTCDGPVFGSCGEHYQRHFPKEKSPESTFIRFRCPECDSVAVLTKKQT